MPELPEVETVVRDLCAARLAGRRITGVRVRWPATIADTSPEGFKRLLIGRTIRAIRRRAKFILWELDQGWLLAVHLRMTGRFEVVADHRAPGKHVHVVLMLDDGRRLWFHDTRKFGRFYLLQDPAPLLARLGPEPLAANFTARRLAEALAGRRRAIKPLLLDQRVVAGLGNIYVDETLWAARIHPLQPAHTLSPAQIGALHRAMRRVLRQGVRNAGTTLGSGQTNFHSPVGGAGRNADQLKVFRRTGRPCPRCGKAIERIQVAQRSTHLCGRCQPQEITR